MTDKSKVQQSRIDGLDTALNAKADKATTLSGYGITNAYTKTEIDTKINSKGSTTVPVYFDENGNATAITSYSGKAATAGVADSANAVAWSNISGAPSEYAPAAHNQASNTINAMTGYDKTDGSNTGVSTSDTLNIAIAKLEHQIDAKQPSGSYVPTTRTVNGKALSADITLSASDVSALPSNTFIPTVTDTYSASSSDGMSGVAVASAISGKADASNVYTKTEVDGIVSAVYKPAGTVIFSNLPTLAAGVLGNVYNVSDAFTTTADFVEGAGKTYPAGSNVVVVNTGTSGSSVYKFDVLSGMVDLSGYQTLITSSAKLSADLVDDSTTTNKFVTASDKTTWSGKQDAISDLSTIRSGAEAGATALQPNTSITGATKTKITYDSKGLVTAGADLQASDIPNLSLSKITDVTATAAEVNVLDGITATTTELNYVDGVTSAIQTQIDGKQATLVSGTNIKTINSTSILGSGDLTIDSLPTQTGQSGKFLTTNGTDASWANVDALPSQTGQSGKFLTTDGSAASWATVDALPSQSGQSGKFLTTDGSSASWGNAPTPATDSTSINTNSSSQLQAIGTVNKNTASGALAIKYDWVGTLSEYTTQGVKTAHPDWICYITDDISGGTSVYTKAEVDALILAANPTGSIIPYAGSTAPTGFLLCDGSAISRTTYSALFSVIGTTYGEGDGNTTFNLPELDFLLKGVKGNGMTLGLSTGTDNFTITGYTNQGYIGAWRGNYGGQIGRTPSGLAYVETSAGVTTDSSKSGIVNEIDNNINYVIKY